MRVCCALVLLVWLGPPWQSARAGDIDVASSIDAVTLFVDRAEVVRQSDYSVPAGRHRLIVTGLPGEVLPQSLQLAPGLVEGEVEFGRVAWITRPLAGRGDAAAQAILDEIEALERQQARLHDTISAEETRLGFVRGLATSLQQGASAGLRRGRADPYELLEVIGLVQGQAGEALTAITDAEQKIADLDKSIELKRRQLAAIDTGARSEQVVAIDIEAEGPARGDFALTYQVHGGQWRPIYEARLDSGSGALQLTQLAMVQQRTGEDWSDVQLRLATSRPVYGGLPDLQPWFIDVWQRPEIMPDSMSENMAVTAQSRPARLAEAAPAPRGIAVVEASGLDTRLLVPQRVSIPSDSNEHQVLIGRWPQEAVLSRRAIPKLQAHAFLSARFDFAGPGPMPAGEVRLFRDGGFIGTAHLGTLVPRGETRLEFGHDDRIEIDYRLDIDGRSSEGIITDYRRTTRRYVAEIINRHEEPVQLTLLDRLPVPRDERIEVERLTDGTSPTITDADDRRGVVAWELDLLPDERQEVRFGFSVVHPADLEVSNF